MLYVSMFHMNLCGGSQKYTHICDTCVGCGSSLGPADICSLSSCCVCVYTYMLNVDWVIPKLAHTCDTVTAFKVRRGLHMWVWCDTVLGASHRNLLSSSRPTLDAISSYGHPSVRIRITIVMIINAWRRRFRDQIDNLGDELRVFLDWHLL